MRGRIFLAVVVFVYGIALIGLVAATPAQQVPPLHPDIFTGTATLDGVPLPEGSVIVACVGDDTECSPYTIKGDIGSFAVSAQGLSTQLGDTVTFYIVNDYGRVAAAETSTYEGRLVNKSINLTFVGPLPTPPPTPTPPPPPTPVPTPTPLPTAPVTLPIPGEPLVPQLANVLMYGGIAVLVLGVASLIWARRRAQQRNG